jgi:hypothetical protein
MAWEGSYESVMNGQHCIVKRHQNEANVFANKIISAYILNSCWVWKIWLNLYNKLRRNPAVSNSCDVMFNDAWHCGHCSHTASKQQCYQIQIWYKLTWQQCLYNMNWLGNNACTTWHLDSAHTHSDLIWKFVHNYILYFHTSSFSWPLLPADIDSS